MLGRLHADGNSILARPAPRGHLDHRRRDLAPEDLAAVAVIPGLGAHSFHSPLSLVHLVVTRPNLPVGPVALVDRIDFVRWTRDDVPPEGIVVGAVVA